MMKRFREGLATHVFTTKYVLREGSPIVYVSHDADGDWQFLGSEPDLKEEDALIISLEEIIAHDPTILDIADLPLGRVAIRKGRNAQWKVE